MIQVVLACRLKSISSQIQRHTPPACNVVALRAGANIRDVTVVCYDLYVGRSSDLQSDSLQPIRLFILPDGVMVAQQTLNLFV